MNKYNYQFRDTLRTIVFRTATLFLLSVLFMQIGMSQECQDETEVALVGLDRKDWAGGGNTNNHSEGALHNFTLPLNTFGDCMKITNVEITFTQVNVDASGLAGDCAVPNQYFLNVSKGCPSLAPASCADIPSIFIHNAGYPGAPINFPTLNFGNPPFDFAFGENIGVDIVPVMNTGCSQGQTAISSGGLVLDYEICVNVTVGPATPISTVDLGVDLEVCPGSTTPIDAGTFDEYLWDPNGEITQTINVGAGNYTVTVTDSEGCTSTDDVLVTELPTPDITFSPVAPQVCVGGQALVGVSETYSNYAWSSGGSGQSINLDAGTYTVTVTDADNCTNTAQVIVNEIQPPNPGADNFVTVCNDGTLYNIDQLLFAHDAGGTWTDDDLSGVNINIDPLATTFIAVTPGTYEYTYTVNGDPPCPSEDATITVQVFEATDAGLSNNTDLCQDPGVVDFFLLLSNPDVIGTFTDVDLTGLDLSNGSAVNLDGLAPGTYEFIYTLPDNGPCLGGESTLFITILPVGNAGSDNEITVCEGAIVDLTDLLSIDATPGGFFLDNDGSGALAGSMVNTTGLAGLTFTFTYELIGGGGACPGGGTSIHTINIETSLAPGVGSTLNLCLDRNIDLYDILTGEDTGGTFTDIDGSGGLSDNILNTESIIVGTYTYQYSIGDGVFCPQNSSFITITFYPRLTADFQLSEIDICEDQCEEIFIDLTGEPTYSINVDFDDITSELFVTDDNFIRFIACNTAGAESFANDTLLLNTDSSYVISMPIILDANCGIDFGDDGDSIVINTIQSQYFILDTMACITDTVEIGGIQLYDGNAVYMDTIPGQRCDSIIDISVTFTNSDTIRLTPTICSEDSIMLFGNWYDQDLSSDEFPIVNPNGCDSLIIIDVSFFPVADSLFQPSLCGSDEVMVNGTIYNAANPSGVEILEDQSSNGCDSTVTIQLVVGSEILIDRNDNLCEGEFIIVGGEIFDETNTTGQVTLSGTGCDTLVTVDLSFISVVEGSANGQFCNDYTIDVNGVTYDVSNPSGQEVLTNASVSGCDSTVMIDLSFFPVSIENYNPPLCQGDNAMVNGTIYDESNPSGTEIIIDGSVNGCDSTINVSLTFLPIFDETNPVELCTGDSLFVQGAWQFVDGQYIDIFQTQDNCDSMVTTDLTFTQCQLTVVVSMFDNLCAGGLDGQIRFLTNSIEGDSYTLNYTGQSTGINGMIDFQGDNTEVVLNDLPSDTYSITITDSAGMVVYTTTITINTLNQPLIGTWSITDSIFCESGFGTISYNPDGGVAPYQFEWSDATIGNTNIASDITSGEYMLTVTDDVGCTALSSFLLVDGTSFSFSAIIMNPSCENASDGTISIEDISSADGPFSITINGELINDMALTGLSGGSYDIVVTDANLCAASMTEVLSGPTDIVFADYTESYSIIEGDSVDLTGNIDPGSFIFEWIQFDNSLSCLDCAIPNAKPEASTTYELTITDENGCSQTITVAILVQEKEVIDIVPNIFSPNGDGANDEFIFTTGSEDIVSIELLVYDRWGNLVFTTLSNNGTVTWDGRMNNKELSNGVYIYAIQIQSQDSEVKNILGDLTLMR